MPELKPLPCPACGSENTHFGIVENYAPPGRDEHFIECWCCDMQGPHRDTESAAIAAWNALPRALTWGEEPPKETGFYWWKCDGHIKTGPQVAYVKTERFNLHSSGLEMMFIHHGPTYHHCDKCQWAGPIPTPLEPEAS